MNIQQNHFSAQDNTVQWFHRSFQNIHTVQHQIWFSCNMQWEHIIMKNLCSMLRWGVLPFGFLPWWLISQHAVFCSNWWSSSRLVFITSGLHHVWSSSRLVFNMQAHRLYHSNRLKNEDSLLHFHLFCTNDYFTLVNRYVLLFYDSTWHIFYP